MASEMEERGVIIRPDDSGEIDEVFASGAGIHIERMSEHGWYIGIDGADGSHWQFWLGAKNMRSRVDVRHSETSASKP